MLDRLGAAVLVACAVFSTGPGLAGEPVRERQLELLHRLEQDCGSCHGMTMKGGLGPALTPEALVGKPDAGLVDAIVHGRPGTPMAPWDFEISEDEAAWLVLQLRRGIGNGE